MTTHAKLAPSAAHRWMHCPGSIALSEGIVEAPSIYAAEGTAAHILAEHCLKHGYSTNRFRGATISASSRWIFAGDMPADGIDRFEVDAEMVDGVQQYLDVVRALEAEGYEVEYEQRVDVGGFADGVFGTGDTIGYHEAGRRVVIVDLKYGKGVVVDAADNEQLLTYALGVAARYHNRGVEEIEIIVVQPRAAHVEGPVRRRSVPPDELFAHAMALKSAADRIHAGDNTLNPGPWCKFCRAAAICPALQREAHRIVGATIDPVDQELWGMADPTKYKPEELAAKLKSAPLIMSWVRAVETFAHAEAMRGHMPPGFKFVAKKANRRWRDEDDAYAELVTIHGLDRAELITTTMVSPAQAEKLLPAKARKAVMETLAIKPSGGVALAPIEDPRPAADPEAANGFEAVAIEGRE